MFAFLRVLDLKLQHILEYWILSIQVSHYCVFFPLEIDEDEEGDRITVRGDEELQAMINGVNYHDNGYIDWIIFKIDAKSNCDRWQKSDCQNSSILASIRV